MELYTVELDYSGTYRTEIEAESATEAYRKANEELIGDCGDGEHLLQNVNSFQVYDEKMQPQDLDK